MTTGSDPSGRSTVLRCGAPVYRKNVRTQFLFGPTDIKTTANPADRSGLPGQDRRTTRDSGFSERFDNGSMEFCGEHQELFLYGYGTHRRETLPVSDRCVPGRRYADGIQQKEQFVLCDGQTVTVLGTQGNTRSCPTIR